jgi:hypothetical protein
MLRKKTPSNFRKLESGSVKIDPTRGRALQPGTCSSQREPRRNQASTGGNLNDEVDWGNVPSDSSPSSSEIFPWEKIDEKITMPFHQACERRAMTSATSSCQTVTRPIDDHHH